MKKESRALRFSIRNEKKLWLVLLLLGALLRCLFLGKYPQGFNPDEASIGYDAWALLQQGIDRNGTSWPLYFIAWGSGQNVLYAYLSMPFIALFGLNELSVRLLAAILGVAALPLFYSLAKKLRGVPAALVAMAVLALNPWHIMASRWGLESNILPFFLLLGLYFLVLALEKPWFYPAAGAALALGLYAYGSAFIMLPVFLLASFVYLLLYHKVRWSQLITGLLVFALIAAPLALCNVANILGWGEFAIGPVTLPILTQTRQASTMSFHILQNAKSLWNVVVHGDDGLIHNTLGRGMLLLPGGAVLAVIGTLDCARRFIKHREQNEGEGYVLLMLASSLLCALVVEGNINRINFLHIPLIYMSAMGLVFLLKIVPRLYLDKNKRLSQTACAWLAGVYLLVGTGAFSYQYFGSYQRQVADGMQYGIGEAIQYAEGVDRENMFVTTYTGMAYMYTLFYTQTPPSEFVQTVVYEDPDAGHRQVSSFGRYTFALSPAEFRTDTVYVLEEWQTQGLTVLATFNKYAVAIYEE